MKISEQQHQMQTFTCEDCSAAPDDDMLLCPMWQQCQEVTLHKTRLFYCEALTLALGMECGCDTLQRRQAHCKEASTSQLYKFQCISGFWWHRYAIVPPP